MSRYIKEDALIARLLNDRGITFFNRGGKELATIIAHQAPSIDIVRCGECKYYEAKEDWCYWRDEAITADDFCSYGERE